jgi:hypothetical protein
VIRYLTGLVTATLAGCAGGWMMLDPFALGSQPAAATWTYATRVDFFTGLGVAVLAAVTLLAWAIAWIRQLRADGILLPRTPHPPSAETAPTAVTHSEPPTVAELHELLVPLVAALAADLHDQHPTATVSATPTRQQAGIGTSHAADTKTRGPR